MSTDAPATPGTPCSVCGGPLPDVGAYTLIALTVTAGDQDDQGDGYPRQCSEPCATVAYLASSTQAHSTQPPAPPGPPAAAATPESAPLPPVPDGLWG